MSTTCPRPDSAQDEINGRLYRRPSLVHHYTAAVLHPPESVALVRYRDDIVGRPVLDLGCGAGRMATFLRPLTDLVVGLDVSPHMVDYCRRNHPGLRFVRGDMRSLAPFEDGSFGCVFALFNLFDAVSHEDRLRAIAEARRVLEPGGLLVFSSHNRNYAHAGEPPRLRLTGGPASMARGLVGYVRACANSRRIRPRQRAEAEYALLNDSGHDYSVLHYYLTREAQLSQLARAGFRPLECLDEAGRTLQPGDDDSANSSIHYVARAES